MSLDPIIMLDVPGLRKRDALEPGFARELSAMATSLGLDPNGMAAVMSLESGVDPQAVNKDSSATGLIQFIPSTATALGTSTSALGRMSAIEQLPFVRRVYAGSAKKIHAMGDYYMAIFMPAFVGQPASTVLGVKGEKVYDQNASLDVDQDGTLTIGDVTRKIDDAVALAKQKPLAVFTSQKSSSGPFVALASVGLVGFLFVRTLRLKGKA